ncbi:Extragenic suppressor of kinetochore protein 1 [Mycena venus]|uniref:Extragenic suppressor of kinetochore protein 1 n=1 Tax=Mycena venus TaxID=2733690 RepID=A0A8H7CHR6_9AGAR|nr:Extragenic suppressor of kinetochore protein 1 [Mycena venus]
MITLPWTQLTHFTCCNQDTVDCVELPSLTPNLETFTMFNGVGLSAILCPSHAADGTVRGYPPDDGKGGMQDLRPRFGFHNASAIDSLLDKEDVSVEAILDEDDLLQECKAQNTRLIDYFQRIDVLQRLLMYVTGQIEGEERGQFKYPYVATEVLCSEIWSIVETCVNSQNELLIPFWEAVLERSPEDMKTQMVMASHFAKINAVFLSKKPAEMLAFIRAQPNIVERLLRHIETPSFVDLLVRIIQLDEQPGGAGVLEWLSSENLMTRLLALLSPTHSADVHTVVAELIKGIISMATPAPGAGLAELHTGPASNRFARELARVDSVTTLAEYILSDFPAFPPSPGENLGSESDTLPSRASCTSAVVHSIAIIIELIRKNNSDYFEPYLFHTLRNRLIQVQQQLTSSALDEDGGRETLERALREMVDRMGVVHLGAVLEILCARLDVFQRYLRSPRSFNGPVRTTVGDITPLTFERYRICELFAELLHCSNMALLNRSPEFAHLYDAEGRLQGGLSALEELARVIALNSGEEPTRDRDAPMRGVASQDDSQEEIEPARELPVTSNSVHSDVSSGSLLDSDEDMSSDDEPGSSDDDEMTMEELAMDEDPASTSTSTPFPISAMSPSSSHRHPRPHRGSVRRLSPPSSPPLQEPPHLVPSSPNTNALPSPTEIALAMKTPVVSTSEPEALSSSSSSSLTSLRSSKRNSRIVARNSATPSSGSAAVNAPLPVGELLKRRFVELDIASTLLDLFFEFPWNNFLHSAVYDFIHQILTGNVDAGSGAGGRRGNGARARWQRMNDVACSKPKSVRLGFMGHLTLIAEDVLTALERFPTELRDALAGYAPQPAWDEYVKGRYHETKRRDAELLGGGKPVVRSGAAATGGTTRWKVDEEDTTGTTTLTGGEAGAGGAASSGGSASGANGRGEFRRATSARPRRENSADFGPAPMEDDDEGNDEDRAPRFEYMANDMSTSDHQFDSDDEDDDGGGWLSQSTGRRDDLWVLGALMTFSPRAPSRPVPERTIPFGSPDDDGFGPFSDAAAADGSDPFTFSSSFSDEMEDTAFDSFADFGEFSAASPPQDGELTPTAGSWTFASDSSPSPSDDVGSEHLEPHSPEEEKRMP